jgi:hypothetical protein
MPIEMINQWLLDFFSGTQKLYLIYIMIISIFVISVIFFALLIRKSFSNSTPTWRDRSKVVAFKQGKFRNVYFRGKNGIGGHSIYFLPPSPVVSSLLITIIILPAVFLLLSLGQIASFINMIFEVIFNSIGKNSSSDGVSDSLVLFKLALSYMLSITFLWAVKQDIPNLRELNDLRGSITRAGFILNFILIIALVIVGILVITLTESFLLGILMYLYAFWLYIVSVVKRTRDIGLDPSWALTAFMPGIQFVYLLFLLFANTDGMRGDRY